MPEMPRVTKEQRDFLQRLNEGWRPLWLQVGTLGRTCERNGWINVNHGPQGSADENKLCCYLTDRGRAVLEGRDAGR